MAQAKWPAMSDRAVIGQRVSRLDGIEKASGKAKYNSDRNPAGLHHAVMVTSPHAHARIKSIDIEAAKKSKGVSAVNVWMKAGDEITYQYKPIAAVAASTEELARDAARKIKVDYEVLPHLVVEDNLQLAESLKRAAPSGEKIEGDPDDAMKKAEVTVEGSYSVPVITHCCLEPHGSVANHKGDVIDFMPSTQAVSDAPLDLGKALEMPATAITVTQDHIGGGFGSKFSVDEWGYASARLSKDAGHPVKLFLERNQELTIAGTRPSFFSKIKVGGNKDGMITAWDSMSWATAGMTGGGGGNNLPYVFPIPNKRAVHMAVATNNGSARAWRAPNHPQFSLLTCAAVEDFAAKIGMDPIEVYKKNLAANTRGAVYAYQLDKAADMIGWKQKYKARGTAQGTVRNGMGIGIATWGGLGHNSTCKTIINPDGTVQVELGSQDLGSGTRTIIAQVVAETVGLNVPDVNVKLGSSTLPKSGGSGGSTTIGGVSSSSRKSTTAALNQLFEKVAPSMGTTADKLVAKGGKIMPIDDASKAISWKEACRKLGAGRIEATESFSTRNPEGLASAGTAGVQMAEVSVDVDTGVVTINKMVAVQDCGLIVNPKLAESQVFGACIMSICAALSEEVVRDQQTGKTLNADMEFYKLSGAKDIGEIEVHLDIRPEHDQRGVIGLGEPPAVPGMAAVANAVANAIGVRVPDLPLTPDRVLKALYPGKVS
jgi:xanthine dehydrogenase YagR molybdenum-binding subunit